jgi:hypothetical protein
MVFVVAEDALYQRHLVLSFGMKLSPRGGSAADSVREYLCCFAREPFTGNVDIST